MYAGRTRLLRTHFFKRRPAARGRARVVGGWLLWGHSSPVLGTSIEDRAVELAYGGGLMSEHE